MKISKNVEGRLFKSFKGIFTGDCTCGIKQIEKNVIMEEYYLIEVSEYEALKGGCAPEKK